MSMTIEDARKMIQGNERSVTALRSISLRMAKSGKPVDISVHEAILDGQKDASRFGPILYFCGARDADFWETVSEARKMGQHKLRARMPEITQGFEDRCGKIIKSLSWDATE